MYNITKGKSFPRYAYFLSARLPIQREHEHFSKQTQMFLLTQNAVVTILPKISTAQTAKIFRPKIETV